MHPADIRGALRKAGQTGLSIAQSVTGRSGRSVSEQAVSNVILGSSRSAAIEKEIARAVDLPLWVLWPERYKAPTTAAKPRLRLLLSGKVQHDEHQTSQLRKEIGARLKVECASLSLSAERAAAQGGISRATQFAYLNGSQAPDACYLARLSFCGIDVAYVVTGTRSRP